MQHKKTLKTSICIGLINSNIMNSRKKSRKVTSQKNIYKHNKYGENQPLFTNKSSWIGKIQSVQFSSVQSLSHVRLFATPWITACQPSLSITNSRSSLRLKSIESVMPSSHLILCRPFSSCPQSLPASESFPMSQLFAWGGQTTGVSALASFLPKKSQGWSPLEWTGWISSHLLQHHS